MEPQAVGGIVVLKANFIADTAANPVYIQQLYALFSKIGPKISGHLQLFIFFEKTETFGNIEIYSKVLKFLQPILSNILKLHPHLTVELYPLKALDLLLTLPTNKTLQELYKTNELPIMKGILEDVRIESFNTNSYKFFSDPSIVLLLEVRSFCETHNLDYNEIDCSFITIDTGDVSAVHHLPDITSSEGDTYTSNIPYNAYNVLFAGTFDRLHIGHFYLLFNCWYATKEVLCIGVTNGVLKSNKEGKELMQDFSQRLLRLGCAISTMYHVCGDTDLIVTTSTTEEIASMENEIITETGRCMHKPKKIILFELNDSIGPAVDCTLFDVLLVTEESEEGGVYVNKKREENSRPKLNLLVLKCIELHESCKIFDKFSSSWLRQNLSKQYLLDDCCMEFIEAEYFKCCEVFSVPSCVVQQYNQFLKLLHLRRFHKYNLMDALKYCLEFIQKYAGEEEDEVRISIIKMALLFHTMASNLMYNKYSLTAYHLFQLFIEDSIHYQKCVDVLNDQSNDMCVGVETMESKEVLYVNTSALGAVENILRVQICSHSEETHTVIEGVFNTTHNCTVNTTYSKEFMWFCDAQCGVLLQSHEQYMQYTQKLRYHNMHLSDDEYNTYRRNQITHLLSLQNIFYLLPLEATNRAHINLEDELNDLSNLSKSK